MARFVSPERTPPIRRLQSLLDEGGELTLLVGECEAVMQEIEKTAKEVGGDVKRSTRWIFAREILNHTRSLRQLASGTYEFVQDDKATLA